MNDQKALEHRVANLERMIEVSKALRSAFDLPSLLQQIINSITVWEIDHHWPECIPSMDMYFSWESHIRRIHHFIWQNTDWVYGTL